MGRGRPLPFQVLTQILRLVCNRVWTTEGQRVIFVGQLGAGAGQFHSLAETERIQKVSANSHSSPVADKMAWEVPHLNVYRDTLAEVYGCHAWNVEGTDPMEEAETDQQPRVRHLRKEITILESYIHKEDLSTNRRPSRVVSLQHTACNTASRQLQSMKSSPRK